MALVQALLVGAVALLIAPGWFFYFDVTPKCVALLAGVAVLLVVSARGRRQPGGVPLFGILLLAGGLSLAISTALSPHPALSFFGSTWRRFGLVTQLAILLFAWTVRRSPVLLRGISAAASLSALYGIAQYFGWDPLLPAAAYHIGEGIWTIVRPPGTLGYVSYFATWLLMSGFLGLWLGATDAHPIWRRAAYISAGLCFIAMALTGTRAALLGLAAGAGVWLWLRGFRIPRRVLAAGVLLFAAGAAFYFSPAGWNLRSRSRWFVEDPWGGARPLLWRDSLRMGTHRLAAGFGPEVFLLTFPQFESKELARAFPDFAHESPHNIFLDALVSQGLPGLVCLAALCVLACVSAWSSKDASLVAALAAGTVAQQFTVFTIPTALIFYTTLALCISGRPGAFSLPSVPWIRLPIAAALLYCAFRMSAADRALELTRRAGDPQAAAVHYARYERWKLPGASADLWYSRYLFNMAQKIPGPLSRLQAVALAGIAGRHATNTAEDPFDAWYNLATLYAAQNDAAGTETSLRRAIAAHPNWFKPHWTLAQLLRLEGRVPEALQEAAIAADLDAGKDPEVAATLKQIRALQP
jgi:tetratricopeptide (TPR) repeat protein